MDGIDLTKYELEDNLSINIYKNNTFRIHKKITLNVNNNYALVNFVQNP